MATKTRHDLLMERIRSQYESNNAIAKQKALEEEEERKRSEMGGFGRGLATGADILDSVGTGLFKGLEGIVDAGASIGGTVGSWFGADDDWAEDFVSTDWVGDFKQNNMQGWQDYINNSYVYDMNDNWEQIIHGSAQSIGQMLPAIAVNLIPGIGQAASVALTTSIFGTSAMGTSVESALQQGNDLQTATGYGLLEGGKEAALELVGAKLGSKVLGAVSGGTRKVSQEFLEKIGKETGEQVSRSLVKEIAKQSLGEGLEEVAGDFLEPFIEKITISKDENIKDLFAKSINQIPMDFISGVLTGSIMNTSSTAIGVKKYGADAMRQRLIIEDAHGIMKTVAELQKTSDLSETQFENAQKELGKLYKEYEKYTKNLEDKFGTESEKYKNSKSIGEEFSNSNSRFNEYIKSAMNFDSTRKIVDVANTENAKKTGFKFEYSGAIGRDEYREVLKKVKESKNEVFNESDVDSNAFIVDKNKIYFNKDSEAYKSGKIYSTLGHEILHAIEDTPEYKEILDNYVNKLSETQKDDIIDEYRNNRGYKNLTDEQIFKEALANFVGENVAVNGNEFARMIGTNSKWSKIKDKLFGYRGILSGDMHELQMKVNKALQTKAKTYVPKAETNEIQFKGRKIQKAIGPNKIKELFGIETHSKIIKGIKEYFENSPYDFSTVNDLPLSSGLVLFKVNGQTTNGKISYNVYDVEKFPNLEALEFVKKDMEEKLRERDRQDGEVNYSKSKRTEDFNADSNENVEREEIQGNLSVSDGTSERNGKRNSERLRNRQDETLQNRGLIDISEDSEGFELTKKQRDRFKNCKFVDEEGRILRLYHGSDKAGFMVFDSESGIYFFTPDYEVASTYTRSSNMVVTKTFKTAKELIDWWYDGGAEEMNSSSVDILPKSQVVDEVNDYFEYLEEYENSDEFLEFEKERYKKCKYVVIDDRVGRPIFCTEEYLVNDFIPYIQESLNMDAMIEEDMNDSGEASTPTNNVYATYVNVTNPAVINCRGESFNNILFRGKRLSTDEIAKIIKSEGRYDGIIFENVMDNGPRDFHNDLGLGNVYVAFEANQIKAIDNYEPTDSDDIRFSRSSTSSEIEEDNLYYVRDLKERASTSDNYQLTYESVKKIQKYISEKGEIARHTFEQLIRDYAEFKDKELLRKYNNDELSQDEIDKLNDELYKFSEDYSDSDLFDFTTDDGVENVRLITTEEEQRAKQAKKEKVAETPKKETAEDILARMRALTKAKYPKPEVKNKIKVADLEKTVQNAYHKIDEYVDKYGEYSACYELQGNYNLSNEEMAMLSYVAWQNGKITEDHKNDWIEALKLKNLDPIETFVEYYAQRHEGKKPEGITIEPKQESKPKVVEEKEEVFKHTVHNTNSYKQNAKGAEEGFNELLTKYVGIEKDSIKGTFENVFNEEEMAILNLSVKRIFETWETREDTVVEGVEKTIAHKHKSLDYLHKCINKVTYKYKGETRKITVRDMEVAINNTIQQFQTSFEAILDLQNFENSLEYENISTRIEIANKIYKAYENFVQFVKDNKTSIFYNIKTKDGVLAREMSGEESYKSRDNVYKSIIEELDDNITDLEEQIYEMQENADNAFETLKAQGKEVAEYEEQFGIINLVIGGQNQISRVDNKTSEGETVIKVSNNEGNEKQSNTSKENRKGSTTKSKDNKGRNNEEIQHTGSKTDVVEETTVKETVETQPQNVEVASETALPVETTANTIQKEKVVVTEIKKVIIQNTRYKASGDNTRTVERGAHLYNKKVYTEKGDSEPLRKTLVAGLKSKFKISFRADGEGYENLNYRVMSAFNLIDDTSVSDRIDMATDYYMEHIETDNQEVREYIRSEVEKAYNTGGKTSKIEQLREAIEAKNAEEISKLKASLNNYYNQLVKEIDAKNTYKQLVKDITKDFKALEKDKNATEKEFNKLKKRLEKAETEFGSKLDENKAEIKKLREDVSKLKSQINEKNNEIKRLQASKNRAEQKKATAMTASTGQKVINSGFNKLLNEIDFTDMLEKGSTVKATPFDSSYYDKITYAMSNNSIDRAVDLYMDHISKFEVTDAQGTKTELKTEGAEWNEFRDNVKQLFLDFFTKAPVSPTQQAKNDAKLSEAKAKGVVALIKASYAMKNKLKSRSGVAGPLNNLAKVFAKGISKPSLTNIENGTYREAFGEAYKSLTTKYNGETILDKFSETINPKTLDLMKEISEKTGDISVEEIDNMIKVLREVSSFINQSAGNFYVKSADGTKKTVKEWAVEGIAQQKNIFYKNGQKRRWYRWLSALAPRVVFKYMDNFAQNGINTQFYEKLLNGETKEMQTYIDLITIMQEYYDTEDGKAVRKELKKEVTIDGFTATVGEFISTWKLLKRKESRDHIASSGLSLIDKNGKRKGKIERRFTKETLDQFEAEIKKYFDFDNPNSIYQKYVDKTTEFFEKAKEIKIATDMDVKGFTNVLTGNEYFPIHVVAYDMLALMGENSDFMATAMQGSREYAFNSSVEGLKGMLKIGGVEDVIQLYTTQLARYAGYARAIDDINLIYNYQLTESDVKNYTGSEKIFKQESLRTAMATTFGSYKGMSNVTRYYNDLLKGVQGMRTINDGWFEKLRKKFASFQLGANLKVMANQLSAIPLALKYVSAKNIIRALPSVVGLGKNIGFADMPITGKYRVMNKSIVQAETLGATAGIFSKGMEFTDNRVTTFFWKACLLECNNNAVEAEKLFDKLNREVQGINTLERSALLRSENSLIKSIMMFTLQPSQNLSNLAEFALHKISGTPITAEQRRAYWGAFGGVLMEGAIFTALALFFKWLLDKDEDDEFEVVNVLEAYFNDTIIGMIPFINSFEVDFNRSSGKFVNLNDFNVGAINQVYEAFAEVQNVFDTESNPLEKLKSAGYALGMATGIPTRNINNYTTAILKKLGVDGAYEWEIASQGYSLYNKEFINDALERNQTKKAWKYYEAYTEKIVDLDESTTRKLYELYADGYRDAYIKQIPHTIESDDVVTETDLDKFRDTYSELYMPLKKLMSHPQFNSLNDARKQKIVKQLVNHYYNIAYKEQSGEALTLMETMLANGYAPSRNFIYLDEIADIKETAMMTRKEAVQKYINRLPLMSGEKYLLYMLAGYKIPEDKVNSVKMFLRSKGVDNKTIKNIFG